LKSQSLTDRPSIGQIVTIAYKISYFSIFHGFYRLINLHSQKGGKESVGDMVPVDAEPIEW
jgi:hypothetical protein